MYNFAIIPEVHSIDAFTEMKEEGKAFRLLAQYEDIHVPKNTILGLATGATAFLFGFAMVWYIWWLAIVSILGVTMVVIIRSADDDTETVISEDQVKRTEEAHFRQIQSSREQAQEVL